MRQGPHWIRRLGIRWLGIATCALGLGIAATEHAAGEDGDEALSRSDLPKGRQAEPAPDGWSFFKDRLRGAGLRLRIEVPGKPVEDRHPVADTMAIRYLAKGTFGAHHTVALDGGDRNRTFVRFDLRDIPADAKVTLRLASLMGNKPLSEPLQVGVYPAEAAWREATLSWDAQPPVADKPALTFALRKDDGWNDVDVTTLVAGSKSAHGWMLRALTPVAPTIDRRLPPKPQKSVADRAPLRRRAGDVRKAEVPGTAHGWSWTRQRESGSGMRLRVQHADGTTTERLPLADAMVIQYIPDGVFGAHGSTSIDGTDRNRTLVRFDLEGLEDAKQVTLRLAMLDGSKPLGAPMEVGIFRIEAAWDEYMTSWSKAPATSDKPLGTFDLPPGDAWIEVDVTAWMGQHDTPHGWLLRATKPAKPSVGMSTPPSRGLPWRRDVLGLLTLAGSPTAALHEAKEAGRPILTLLRASYNVAAENTAEDLFLACALADPDVHTLVRDHFVAYRTFQRGWTYTIGEALPRDPLAPLGIASHEVKPFALLVSSADGRLLDSLQGMGTFHAATVRAFLLRHLGEDAAKTAPPDESAAHYRQALAAHVAGHFEQRSAHFAKIDKKSPWHLKVRAWQQWPDRMAQYERPAVPELASLARDTSTEILDAAAADVVPLALTRLISLQRTHGGWGAAAGYAANEAGISALAILALERHAAPIPKEALAQALARAASWRDGVLEHADPVTLNAWGGCYLLDLLVDRLDAKVAATKTRAQRAVTLLQGGQLKHGAWSYDRRFGETWRGGFGGWPVTTDGRAHSMNTGPALVALAEAKAAGLRVSEEALSRGAEALLAMRDAPAVFTYTWPGKRNFNTLEQSIGRACGCEHALFLLGKNKRADLELAIATFMANREHFWNITKVTAGWSPPRAISSYFCFFAYYQAARAIRALGGEQMAPRLALLRKDVLAHVEIDGTWVDYEDVGKSYGTAMGLLLLDLTAPK